MNKKFIVLVLTGSIICIGLGKVFALHLKVINWVCFISFLYTLSYLIAGEKKVFEKIRPEKKHLFYFALFYVVSVSGLGILRYYTFRSEVLDLGLMRQLLWNTAHGHWFEVTHIQGVNGSFLAGHWVPIAVPIAFLYRFVPTVEFMLILQAVIVALATYPIYLTAKEVLDNKEESLWVAFIFLLFPALHLANLYDFHFETLLVTPVAFAILFMVRRQYKLLLIASIVALLCKETASLILVPLGMYALLIERDWKSGLILIVLPLLVFLVYYLWIIPVVSGGFNPQTFRSAFGSFGEVTTPFSLVFALFRHPWTVMKLMVTWQNGESLIWLFLPLLFIPFVGWPQILISLPLFLKGFLMTLDIGNHRLIGLVPVIFFAYIYGLRALNDSWRKASVVSVILCTLVIGELPPSQRFCRNCATGTYFPTREQWQLDKTLSKIDAQQRISCSPRLFPHVANRRVCYTFPAPDSLPVDLFIVDVKNQYYWNWISKEQSMSKLQSLQRPENYHISELPAGLFWFQRK